MARGFRAADGTEDPAVLADDVGHALDQVENKQVGDLDAIQAADAEVRIEQQIEGKRLLGPKPPVGIFGIRAYTENDGVFHGKLFGQVAEPARLSRSAGRPVLGEEEEHQIPPPEVVFQPNGLSVLVARGEWRREATDFQHDLLW